MKENLKENYEVWQNIITDSNVTSFKPSWIQLPEEELQKKYWFYGGKPVGLRVTPKNKRWLILFQTSKEANAHAEACVSSREWEWDGFAAKQTTLHWMLVEAKNEGYAGVRIVKFKNAKQKSIILKEYLV